MIVYGDLPERREAGEVVAALGGLLARAAKCRGVARRAVLVDALILAGRLAQAVADADPAEDGASLGERALQPLLARLADSLLSVIRTDEEVDSEAAAHALAAVDPASLPVDLNLVLAEGFAFYGVFPEAYAAAAAQLPSADWRVIGIRSIGTSLAALVARVLSTPPPLTVRPVGDPFDRRIALAPAPAEDLLSHSGRFVVVDEGPGLSGSSFAAVAAWLEERGVARGRIAFLPSHPHPPGAEARPATLERWATVERPVVTAETLIPNAQLATWAAALVDRPLADPLDLSGGRWRALTGCFVEAETGQERRKLHLSDGSRHLLVKFAGLGQEAERKLERARILFAAGLVPEPIGCVHGHLVERWEEGDRLAAGDPAIVDAAGQYIGRRAALLPRPAWEGASSAALVEMALVNTGEALGSDARDRIAPLLAACRPSARDSRSSDNRCLPHEWLRTPEGRILKTDALDHDRSHDLIGPQGPGWDVAGTIVEFNLDDRDADRLRRAAERAGAGPIAPERVRFNRLCYLAFRIGVATFAGTDRARGCYAGTLDALLSDAAA